MIISQNGHFPTFYESVIPGPFNLCRLKRIADVAFDQARSLRVRSYVNFLQNNPAADMYLQIGSNPLVCINRYASTGDIEKLTRDYDWLSTEKILAAATYKTTLARMMENDFDLLVRHKYETALWNETVFLQTKSRSLKRKADDHSPRQV